MACLPVTRSSGKRPLMNRSRIGMPLTLLEELVLPGVPVINGRTLNDSKQRLIPLWISCPSFFRMVSSSPFHLPSISSSSFYQFLFLSFLGSFNFNHPPSLPLPRCQRNTGFVETHSPAISSLFLQLIGIFCYPQSIDREPGSLEARRG